MEEKYRLCDDTLTELLSWVGEIEDRISNQDVAQEDVNQLRNQINILKVGPGDDAKFFFLLNIEFRLFEL